MLRLWSMKYSDFKFKIHDGHGKEMASVKREYPNAAVMMAEAENLYRTLLQALQALPENGTEPLPEWAKDGNRLIERIDEKQRDLKSFRDAASPAS